MTRLSSHPAVDADTVEATERVATALGRRLGIGDMVSLDGPLGAGKTVFVRGLARGRDLDPLLVRSPTFVFHHLYGVPPRLHHLDLYRLGESAVLNFLDIDGLLDTAPVAVEWGSLADLGRWRPLRLRIDTVAGETRRIDVLDSGDTPEALLAAWRQAVAGG